MDNILSESEEDFWDKLKYGPSVFTLHAVNNFIIENKCLSVFCYLHVRKHKYKVRIIFDESEIPETDFKYEIDGISISTNRPTGCRIEISRPVRFSCVIPLNH